MRRIARALAMAKGKHVEMPKRKHDNLPVRWLCKDADYLMTPELRKVALDAAREYLEAAPLSDGRTLVEFEQDFDARRANIIESALKPLLKKFLEVAISIADFKRQVDGINKQNKLWGFSGTKGQMFFNMLVNAVDATEGVSELDDQLRPSIRQPTSDENASLVLKNFKSYVTRVGQQFVDAVGEPRSKPSPNSVPFFLSYFWHIQERNIWPVYYTSSVQVIEGMNLWQATGDVGQDYLAYKKLHEDLAVLFSKEFKRKFSLYDVEHVFWFKSGRLVGEAAPVQSVVAGPTPGAQPPRSSKPSTSLLDGYVPPIVATIPGLAANAPELQEAARHAGTTLERALEKGVHAAFTMLGYETQLLGQGAGRVPDGQAMAINESYALLWDAKARSDGYRMGTDDRTIREYIDSQSRNLKRRGIRNIYYLIISSNFADEFDDLVRSLKMGTDINEVCFVEASALVELVNQKLRAPLSVGLGSDGIQRLFSVSGIVTASDVLDLLNV
jgi:hypothetical protein